MRNHVNRDLRDSTPGRIQLPQRIGPIRGPGVARCTRVTRFSLMRSLGYADDRNDLPLLRWHYASRATAALGEPEVGVLGDHGEPVLPRVLPDDSIVGLARPDLVHMNGAWKLIAEQRHEPRREVLIEPQLHAGRTRTLRSRSAAQLKHARMSSRVR